MPDKNNSIKQIIEFRVEKLNKLRELDYQIRRAGDIPPTIITDFTSGSGVTRGSKNEEEIDIKLNPEDE